MTTPGRIIEEGTPEDFKVCALEYLCSYTRMEWRTWLFQKQDRGIEFLREDEIFIKGIEGPLFGPIPVDFSRTMVERRRAIYRS